MMNKLITVTLPREPATRQRALVLREVQYDSNAQYATSYEDLETQLNDRFYDGNYFQSYEEALADFQKRCQKEFDRYDRIMDSYWEITRWQRRFERAKALALEIHQEQRYGDYPYHHHLREVVYTLMDFGATVTDPDTAPILVAAWLHDSLEDTDLQLEEIRERFGSQVAEIVWKVTDEKGDNRKERKTKTYAKTCTDEKAIILKLADRIANVKASQQNNPKLLKMYADEQSVFSEALRPYSKSQLSLKLWDTLDQCFSNNN